MNFREELLYLGYNLLKMPLRDNFKLFVKTQHFSKEEMLEYQSAKLRSLINHAFHHVPYYNDVFKTYGITPSDIKDIRDITRIPVLSKNIIREVFPDRIVASNIPSNQRLFKRTSGSTGTPLEFYNHKKAISVSNALLYRALSWTGHHIGDPFLFLWGVGQKKASPVEWLRRSISDKIVMDTNVLDQKQLHTIYQMLVRKKIKLVFGYPSALAIFSQYLHKNNINLAQEVTSVTTAEVLTDVHKEMISAALSSKIFDMYGCNEINMIGFGDASTASYTLSAEHVWVEVLDENQQQVSPGISGRIVCTDFDNYAMPFLRYDFGDRASMRDNTSALPVMNKVDGRAVDFVKGNDARLHSGVVVQKLLRGGLPGIEEYKSLGIEQFQLVQQQDGSLDISLVTRYELNDIAVSQLKSELFKMMGDMNIRVKRVEGIAPEKSGKRRTIISKVNLS